MARPTTWAPGSAERARMLSRWRSVSGTLTTGGWAFLAQPAVQNAQAITARMSRRFMTVSTGAGGWLALREVIGRPPPGLQRELRARHRRPRPARAQRAWALRPA